MSSPAAIRTRPALAPALPFVLTLAAACLVWAALFREEIAAAVGVWSESTAYSHCFLVLPVAAFLAWDRRDRLAGLTLRPAPVPAATLAVPVLIGWFAAERLGIMELRQFGALALLLLTVLAVVGWAACRAMAAPLLYLVFLVPFGAFITPILQQITLDLTMLFLNAAGIPAVSDGFTIEVPHAVFYVAEACAGLRFLIASIAFGTLYALLIYRTPGRRATFIAASVAIPVLANGVRAFGIVTLGYLLSSAEAAAADHLIYGWIFFSIVIVLLILAGLPFRQDVARPAALPRDVPMRTAGPRPWGPAALLLLLTAAGPVVASGLDRAARSGFMPAPPALPVEGCATGATLPAGTAETVTPVDCGGGAQYSLRVAVLPSRSTSAAVLAAERRAGGQLQAEISTASTLQAPAGPWALVETDEPAGMTATSTWRDGAPAVGGIAGRIAQARDSLFGSDHAPVVVTLSWDPHADRLPPARMAEASGRLAALLARQTGWPAAIERLSREAAR